MLFVKFAALFVFYLALAKGVIMDLQYKKVRRYVWWIALLAGVVLHLANAVWGMEKVGIFLELIVFAVFQYALFSRLYGLADCHAFVCCSVVLGAYGGRMTEYLLHMLFAMCLLAGVQLGRKNVNRQGNLVQPVAFVPYIAVGFYLTLLWMNYS